MKNKPPNECLMCKKPCKGECCSGACRARLSRFKRTRTDDIARARSAQQGIAAAPAPMVPQVIPGRKEALAVTALDQLDLSSLPAGVSKPTGHRTAQTEAMTSQQLYSGIRSYRGLDWIASSELAEIIYRLQTWTVEQLNKAGQFVPAWKLSEEVPA